MLTMIDCKITVGATGAVSSFSGNLVQNVVRNSVGNYTITLQSQCNLNATICFLSGIVGPANTTSSGVDAIEKSPLSSITANPATIVVQCFNAGTATDPASGSIIEICQLGRNSSVAK